MPTRLLALLVLSPGCVHDTEAPGDAAPVFVIYEAEGSDILAEPEFEQLCGQPRSGVQLQRALEDALMQSSRWEFFIE